MDKLRIVSYNCRGIKSSIPLLGKMCESNDIILLQETMLCSHNLDMIGAYIQFILIFMPAGVLQYTEWGAVAQWLERATDNRVVAGSNPAEAVWKLWQFPLPHFASVFRKRH